jgi:predicted Zn-dependent peptidase
MNPLAPPNRLNKLAVLCLLTVFATGSSAAAQVNPIPQKEELLNGLRVLIWARPADQNVLIKLRIHSGAAFDLAGKAGAMALLGDMLFPDPATREYFTEQMQGRLQVVTDHDSMTITMQGQAREFERMVEILRNALVSTQLTPELVNNVRENRIKIVKETGIAPEIVADRAIAARLFGDFPYGRPRAGTSESIARVDRADLMLARDRFLNPNNATIAVAGGVPATRVVRTLRQLLGIWRKSEQIVPSTFKQPEPPDPRTLLVNSPNDQSAEVRLATRGLARSDSDAPTAEVLAVIIQSRWEKALPEISRGPVFVSSESRVLPGIFVIGATVNTALAAKALNTAKDVLKGLASAPVPASELDEAKSTVLKRLSTSLAQPDGVAEAWLDLDTYKVESIARQTELLQNATPADIQRTASKLFVQNVIASVTVGNVDVLRASLEKDGQIEVLGEVKPEAKLPAQISVPKPNNSTKPH